MAESAKQSDHWGKCPAGELERMAQGIKAGHRKKTLHRIGAAAGLVVLLVVAGITVYQFSRRPLAIPAPLACRDVQPLLANYIGGQLDPELATRIRFHLENCEHCEAEYRRLLTTTGQTISRHPKTPSTLVDGESG